jgi:hypothetical protein
MKLVLDASELLHDYEYLPVTNASEMDAVVSWLKICCPKELKNNTVRKKEWMQYRLAVIIANTDDDEFEKMRYIVDCDNICFITILVWREFRHQWLLYGQDFERFGWKK